MNAKRRVAVALCLLAAPVAAMGARRETVRLMSFNVCHCEGMDRRIDLERTAARIRAEDPDFACLQEIDWRTARSGGVDQPEELARLTGMHPTFARAIFYRGGQYGVMMLSRGRPKSVVRVPLPGSEPRVLLLCEFEDCVVGTTHLSVAGADERKASLDRIREAVAPFAAKKPVFLTGDWNSLPDSDVVAGMGEFMQIVSKTDRQTFHGRQEDGPDGQPLDMTRFCIDYVACDRGHAADHPVVEARVVEDGITSDHAPVVVTLGVPDPDPPEMSVVPVPAKMRVNRGWFRVGGSDTLTDVPISRKSVPALPAEGYELRIDADGISVGASGDAGYFYARRTLAQLAGRHFGRLVFPCCDIVDAPRFAWRGVHFDDSRHFFGKAAVKRTMDAMSQHKFNTFHWHLTDSEGWRLPVRRHPRLTTEGAVRSLSTNQKNLADHFEDGNYGPYSYGEADIVEIAEYARERHIRIVPEVDFPGHSRAVLKAYPQLGCFLEGESAPAGAVDNVLCAGKDEALELMLDVLDEVVRLFPDSPMVHIGGDEVNKANWKSCPHCQKRIRDLDLVDENGLQSWLMGKLAERLRGKGRNVVGWDEMILDGKAPVDSVVMSWRGAEGGCAAARAGHYAVMCPHMYCYFDYDQCLSDDPAVYPWFSRRLPLQKAYAFDPLEGIPSDCARFVLGGQCCNWSEYTCNETELQWKMWPRACATAEVLWSPAGKRDWNDFRRRMAQHRRRLLAQHVNCATLEDSDR